MNRYIRKDELEREQIQMLRSTFDAFDVDQKGYIETDMIGTILDMLGTQLVGDELQSIINEIDEDGNGEISFDEFANLVAKFLVEEEEDTAAIQLELKGAFRFYDKEGNGFITTDVLREILKELDDKLSDDELDNMIDEIDTDGSGTVDWDEFKARTHSLRMSKPATSKTEPKDGIDEETKKQLEELAKKLELHKDQLVLLKQTFVSFDVDKKGYIDTEMIGQILDMLGHQLTSDELQSIVAEIDEDGNGELSFEEFAHLAARFLAEEEEDTEAILRELKNAFRLYDREGLGFITTDLLREILKELDDKMTKEDLDQMIEEIDTDGSGTVDWEEFKAMMIG
ncbi:hypothetical protein ILUMI_05176 [Ignelater luminosus]|uniref:EF-hand domain-containing protein n=1 Tax=Ignelater luminosus TaxID=2038154 RepID=A0A8K0DB09_IGNLU|nr:hypothetical protein ILUMI_05176 [Ignelater luminosus]